MFRSEVFEIDQLNVRARVQLEPSVKRLRGQDDFAAALAQGGLHRVGGRV